MLLLISQSMESNYNLVIKVKYGDTLRRFNADISDDGERLYLNMAGLRAKIISLFIFPADTEFTLTYMDEDGDVVTLVDDDDLYDVMRQNLKFLRIDVQLNNAELAKPSRSSFLPPPVPVSAADPLGGGAIIEALSKLSVDVASKVVSAGPVLVDLVDCLSKIGQSYMSPVSEPVAAADSSMPVATDPEPSRNGGLQAVLPRRNDETRGVEVPTVSDPGSTDSSMPVAIDPSPSSDGGLRAILAKHNDATRGVDSDPGSIDLNVVDPLSDANLTARKKGKSVSFYTSAPYSTKVYHPSNRIVKYPSNGVPFSVLSVAMDPVVPPPISQGKKVVEYFTFHKGIKCDGCGGVPIAGPRFKSKVKDDHDLCNICFSKLGNEKADYIRMDRAVPSTDHIARALPHVSRKRAVKSARPELDNDFILDINFMDGTAMAPSTPFLKIWRMHNSGTAPWFPGMQVVWIGGHKLRSSTSVDIKIPADGVPIDGVLDIAVDFNAPEFPGKYHSYWMMASQAGKKFGQHLTVLINVDASLKETSSDNNLQGLDLNFLPQISTDIALDEQSRKEPTLKRCDVPTPIPTLSSPVAHPPIIGQGFSVPTFPEIRVSVFSDPVIDPSEAAPGGPSQMPSFSAPSQEEVREKVIDPSEALVSVFYDVVIDPSEAAPGGPSQMSSPSAPYQEEVREKIIHPSEALVSVFYDVIIDPSEAAPGGPSQMASPSAPSQEEESENAVEQVLLKELEEMGFKQVDMKKEILRRNEFDLEKTIDDLCEAAEWDTILETILEEPQ